MEEDFNPYWFDWEQNFRKQEKKNKTMKNKTKKIVFDSEIRSLVEIFHPKMKMNLLAVGLFDGTIEILKIDSGERLFSHKGHEHSVLTLISTSDGGLVSGCCEGVMKKWDLSSAAGLGKEVWARDVNIDWDSVNSVNSVLNNTNDQLLVVGATKGSLRVLDRVSGNEVMACKGHTDWVNVVISLQPFHSSSFHPLQTEKAPTSELLSFASGSDDTTIRVWVVEEETPAQGPQKEKKKEKVFDPVGGSAVGFPRRVLATRIIEVGREVHSLSLSPCGHFVAVGCGDESVKLYKLPDWDQKWSARDSCSSHYAIGTWSVSWSPDGKFIVSGSGDKNFFLVSASTGVVFRTFLAHTSCVLSVCVSSDGTRIITGSRDKTVRVWHIFETQDSQVASFVSSSLSIFALDLDFYDLLVVLHSFLNPLMVDRFVSLKID